MIRISSLLEPSAIAADINVASKTSLFEKLAELAARVYNVDSGVVAEGLLERERLGPTGFGGGTAIPHCKLDTVTAPVGLFFRLAKPVDYLAVDDEPVDLVFCLISPSRDGATHLRALAEVSRMFRNDKFCGHLRGAGDADALFALMHEDEERDAA